MSMDVNAEVLIRHQAKGLGRSSAICTFELQRSWLSSRLKLHQWEDVRNFSDGGSDCAITVVGMSLDGDDDALVISTEPDHPVGRPLDRREETLRLLIQWVLDDHVDLEVHGSTVSNMCSYRNVEKVPVHAQRAETVITSRMRVPGDATLRAFLRRWPGYSCERCRSGAPQSSGLR